MSVEELLAELRKLDRADKLRAMHALAAELADEHEPQLRPNGQYEVWSPVDAADAAATLARLLEADATGQLDRGR